MAASGVVALLAACQGAGPPPGVPAPAATTQAPPKAGAPASTPITAPATKAGGGGTLVVIYLHMRQIGRAPFRATVAALWLFEMIARIAGYGAAGAYTFDTLLLCAVFMPFMAAGTWVGERLGNRPR